jgi:hypothetical protein
MVLSGIFLIYIYDIDLFETQESKIKNEISNVIGDCLKKDIINSANLLGLSGGVIGYPAEYDKFPFIHNKKFVDLGIKVLNWDIIRDKTPTISSMEKDIKNNINESSKSCIKNNIKSLNHLNIKFKKNYSVNIEINDYSIVAQVSYPLTYNEINSNKYVFLENFRVEVNNLPLGKSFELAKKIYNKNKQTYFLEDLVMDQILSANDYDDKNSFPTEGLLFSCSKKIWTKDTLKKNLARMNNANFKFIQFKDTFSKKDIIQRNIPIPEFRDYYYKQYVIDLGLNSQEYYGNFLVDIFMPSVEITGNKGILKKFPYRKFEVNPSSGNIIKAKEFNVLDVVKVSIPCMQVFGHKYDLDYDLIVKINDLENQNSNFFFQFPIRIQIEKNYPKKEAPVFLGGESKTLNSQNFCKEENRHNKVSLIGKTKNGYLNGVSFKYSCLASSCDLENKSQKDKYLGVEIYNSIPNLKTTLPYCFNGKLSAEKEGYFSTPKEIQTLNTGIGDTDKLNTIDIELYELKKYKLDLANLLLISKETGRGIHFNEETMNIFITIENKNLKFTSTTYYPNKQKEYETLKLIRGLDINYNVSVYLMDNDDKLLGYSEFFNKKLNYRNNQIVMKLKYFENGLNKDVYKKYYSSLEEQTKDNIFRIE